MPGVVTSCFSIINVQTTGKTYMKSSHSDTKNVSIWNNSNLYQNVLILPDHD
jgi:hypothetical protein